MAGTGQATTGLAGEQFFVTHCLTADSAMNSPGYSVRATSALEDTESLRLALEYPPYELPIELWREKPTKAMAPRRLARTPHPHGGVWVVHSVYLEKDTMNRDRSYFSHLIQLPASADPAAILRSWDSPEWIKEYPSKAEKKLPRGRIPTGVAISDETLAEFLSGTQDGPTELAAIVCPVRLRSDLARRRELVLQFLHGLLRVIQEDENRDRLFVHAEPGLVAMLLYAAMRILPPAWVADLTFSTFEPGHRGLRDYQLARIIGTYSGPSGKGLDPELATSRGYGLDTLRPERSSKELSGPNPPGLDELLQLAAEGEWSLLAEVHRLIGTESDALSEVSRMIPLARAVSRLNRGEPTIDDLLILRADARGAATLADHAEKVWPYVRDGAMTDARICATFKDWLASPVRLDEFRRDAAKALVKDDLEGWEARWSVVQQVTDAAEAKEQLEKAMKTLDKHLPSLPITARMRLRDACAAAGAWPDHHLLAPTSPEELTALLSPLNPPDWQGYTCFAVLGPTEKNWLLPSTEPFHAAMRDRVRRHLLTAPLPVLTGYLKQARAHISADPIFFLGLLQPHSKVSVAFLDRLIDAGAASVDATDWLKLLTDLNIYEAPEWQGFMFQNDHLAKLLSGFRADPAATKFWGDYLDLLSVDIFDGDEWEQTLYHQLKKARVALGAAGIEVRSVLPRAGLVKLNAIDCLLTLLDNPAAATGVDAAEVLKASQVFWPNDPHSGLRDFLQKFFFKGGFNTIVLPAEAQKLDALIAVFLACFPITHENYSARTAVAYWLALSANCPEESRAEFQLYFVQKCVIHEWYPIVLEDDNRHFQFMPAAEARIREAMAATAPGERYSKPASRRADSEEGGVDFASSATKRARKEKGRGRGAARRQRSSGLSGGTLAVIVVGIMALILIVAAAIHFGSGQTKPTQPDHEPPPPPKQEKKAPAPAKKKQDP